MNENKFSILQHELSENKENKCALEAIDNETFWAVRCSFVNDVRL